MNTANADALAQHAVAPIANNTVVALGTGRAASRAVRALAHRIDTEGLNIKGVPTSRATQQLATELNIPLIQLKDAMHIDYLFDGADEVDPQLRMIKGRGGAMTQEKIAAHAARTRVYLIDQSKRVQRLGQHHPLPVEVLEPALAFVTVRLEYLGFNPQLRVLQHTDTPAPYRTDNNSFVLDIAVPDDRPPEEIDVALRLLPGVVGHGLFLDEADRVLVEDEDGNVTSLTRTAHTAPAT